MGLRKRISIGFMSLVALLFFAVAISVAELGRLRSDAREIVDAGKRGNDLAAMMMSGLQKQNSAILRMVATEHITPDSEYDEGKKEFENAYAEAMEVMIHGTDLDAVTTAEENYRSVVESYLSPAPAPITNDSTGMLEPFRPDAKKFLEEYLPVYYSLDEAVKRYMASPQSSIARRTAMVEDNAYRTITPSIITLLVAILVVLMFHFFIDIYYIKPVLRINKSLEQYLATRVPFAPKVDGENEISGLRDNIEKLIELQKSKKA
ncbi:MAG: hypothetical protein IKK02_02765 [Tidjanibacter sp.]|nr:hypothetical protein [Tidjanibacter sp.]MBR6813342.1 hypothetical protein [Tidjanibacter sp.]